MKEKDKILEELKYFDDKVKVANEITPKIYMTDVEKAVIIEDSEDHNWEIILANIEVLRSAYKLSPIRKRKRLEEQLEEFKGQLKCTFDFPCIVVYNIYAGLQKGVRPIHYWDTVDLIERKFWGEKGDNIKGVYLKKRYGKIGEKDAVKIKIFNLQRRTKNDISRKRSN